MATAQEEYITVDDIRVCSICFEQFKTPRYLPCKHSFCQGCLSSYIINQCKSTDPRLGFHCPLCRVYIPSDGDPRKPEGWAELFPLNDILQKRIDKQDGIFCDPCFRENDHEQATNYCATCKEYLCTTCTKYHRRNSASRDHTIFTASEINSIKVLSEIEFANGCPNYQREKVDLYCHDHDLPICGLCGGTEHRKCEKVATIENALQALKESGKMNTLLNDIKEFKKKLLREKTEKENNLLEIENMVEENITETEEEFLAVMQHFQQLKTDYIDEMCTTMKKGRDKLQREIEKFEDGIHFVDNCEAAIKSAQETKNIAEAMGKFSKANGNFQKVKHCNFKQLRMKYYKAKVPGLRKLKNFKKSTKSQICAFAHHLDYDIRSTKLSLSKEFTIKNANVFCGSFLYERKFLVANYNENKKCLVYNRNWECICTFECLHKPFDAIQCKEELFVTNVESESVEVFSSNHFTHLRSISFHGYVYGITSLNGNLFVAFKGNQIIKFDRMGNTLKKYNLIGLNNAHLTATKSGLIVYSDWKLETVTTMTDEGHFKWTYHSSNLKQPRNLDIDTYENIYVAGRNSNNIHVLASTGELIREIGDILNPTFCKINEEEGVMCVCSRMDTIKVFQIYPKDIEEIC